MESAEPRQQILNVSKQLEDIFSQDVDSWFSNSGNQLEDAWRNAFRKQFVARLYRGAIIKSSLTKDNECLGKDKEAQKDFYQKLQRICLIWFLACALKFSKYAIY